MDFWGSFVAAVVDYPRLNILIITDVTNNPNHFKFIFLVSEGQLSCWLWQTTWISLEDLRSKKFISYISNPYQQFNPSGVSLHFIYIYIFKNHILSFLLSGKCFGCQHYLDFLWSFLQTLLLGGFPWLSMVPVSEWYHCLFTENWIRLCLWRKKRKNEHCPRVHPCFSSFFYE